MVITYQGLEFFKIQLGDTVLAFNPPAKQSSLKSSRFGADLVLSSTLHEDFLGGSMLSKGDKEPFLITGPGEYEFSGITVKGAPAKTMYGGKEGHSTVYLVTLEGIQIVFLGPISSVDALSRDAKEMVDNVDILFVPIGSGDVLSPVEAYNFAVKLEPHIIIPMHYEGDKDKNLTAFLKEAGGEKKPTEKLTIKLRDLTGKDGEVVVLSE